MSIKEKIKLKNISTLLLYKEALQVRSQGGLVPLNVKLYSIDF